MIERGKVDDWQRLAEALSARFHVVEQSLVLDGRRYELVKPRSSDELISEDDFNRDERLPYWADIWPAALCLAECIARQPQRGERLLELGCGVGCVCAVAAARGFAVVATDYYAEALEFTTVNLARNGLPPATTRLVDWRDFPTDLGRYDLVVAADVIYEKAYPALVASCIARSLKPQGVAFVADPGRPGAGAFERQCHQRGLTCHRISQSPYHNGTVEHRVDLYEIRFGVAML